MVGTFKYIKMWPKNRLFANTINSRLFCCLEKIHWFAFVIELRVRTTYNKHHNDKKKEIEGQACIWKRVITAITEANLIK